jgi:hypothetical protein
MSYLTDADALYTINQVELAQTADFERFEAYIKRTFLGPQAHVALVKRNNLALLQAYIERFTMYEEAQIELVKSKNKKALLYYVQKRPLCAAAQ